MLRTVRELLGNFTVSGEWSPCVMSITQKQQWQTHVTALSLGQPVGASTRTFSQNEVHKLSSHCSAPHSVLTLSSSLLAGMPE